MSIPKFTLALKTIESFNDSTEVGNDEPYLLIVGADFTHASALVIDTTRYGPFSLGRSEMATTFPMPFGTPAILGLEEPHADADRRHQQDGVRDAHDGK